MSRKKPTLNPELLCQAYSLGYFPMPDPDTGKIVFLRPDPRAVLPLNGFHVSRSFQKTLKKPWRVTFDTEFHLVMEGCADRKETWITQEFFEGYKALFEKGNAHSVEVWSTDQKLVGGLYGVHLGGAFFAESKFHRVTDASKVALYSLVTHLKEKGFALLEVQFQTAHLKGLGVVEIADEVYQGLLADALQQKVNF